MKCTECGHNNRAQAAFCEKCGAKLVDLADHKQPEPPSRSIRPRGGFSLLKMLAMGLACLVVLLTVYVALNSLLAELSNSSELPSGPLLSYIIWGVYFAAVFVVCGFLARKWKGLRFWETALGALAAAAVFGLLINAPSPGTVVFILGLAGILGAWLGSLGQESSSRLYRSGK
jgi:chromate transport protein ChrA